MIVFRGSWSNFTDVRDSVVTVGLFDGLHLGHRAIIEHVVTAARAQSLRSVLLTFDAHPRDVLKQGSAPVPLLTTLEEKLALLGDSGLDLTLVIHFDHGLSRMSAGDFVQIVLKGRIGMRKIVVGFNHGFGKHRSGDRETLIAMSRSLGFSVDVVNPACIGETIISSSGVREMIAEGEVERAAEALGRNYSVCGVVVHGFGRGQRLGWPTANLGLIGQGKLSPRDGIYAGLAKVKGEAYPAAISIGYNPTFTEAKHSVEAHLIEFDGDIYDEEVELEFVARIRNERKFGSEDELSAQISDDVKSAVEILESRGLLSPRREA